MLEAEPEEASLDRRGPAVGEVVADAVPVWVTSVEDSQGLGTRVVVPADTPEVGAGPGIRPMVVVEPAVAVEKATWGTVTV
ncbi:hypothetical protein CNMCM5623_002092 [Aspergillus felis]|uniref:Uncharacterized protein n=1 Tax=Aspergillus felis TaxID=1287682 RepID=A0A8H6UW67_9EURO|nr:hypothetical protein CNMCM5623_002092 [Aspergillus felis]KAF7182774.1 hypothetical protein CNMCM7691_002435 [Aspergillus felis]